MDAKPRPNHAKHMEVLRRMTPAQRLAKAFELTEFARAMHLHGLRRRFPHLDEEGLRREAARRRGVGELLDHQRGVDGAD